MKNFKLAALTAALAFAFSGVAMADSTASAVGNANGNISNSVSAVSSVGTPTNAQGGVQSSASYAGSQAISSGSVGAGTWTSSGPGGLWQASSGVMGSTNTSISGYAGNISSAGVGDTGNSAKASGWSDSAVSGTVAGNLGGTNCSNPCGVQVNGGGNYSGTAAVDNGGTTISGTSPDGTYAPVLHGPDLSVATSGVNTGIQADAYSGGSFTLAGNVANNNSAPANIGSASDGVASPSNSIVADGRGGYVSDNLAVNTYGNTSYAPLVISGSNGAMLMNGVAPTLNSGATANAALTGGWTTGNVIGANENQVTPE